MHDLDLDAHRALDARVTRIEKVLTSEGAFAKLDEAEAKLQADHEAKLVEVNKQAADEQAAYDAASPDERAQMALDKRVAAKQAEIDSAAAVHDAAVKLDEQNFENHMDELHAELEGIKALPIAASPTRNPPEPFVPPAVPAPGEQFAPYADPRPAPIVEPLPIV